MNRDLIVSTTPSETRVALLEEGVVSELFIEREAQRGIVGSIYLGRVSRVLPGMQSAFVDVGLERDAFLHAADVHEDLPENLLSAEELATARSAPIEDRLHEGQEILVQVLKEPLGQKGARITSHCSLPGRYLVLMPTVDHRRRRAAATEADPQGDPAAARRGRIHREDGRKGTPRGGVRGRRKLPLPYVGRDPGACVPGEGSGPTLSGARPSSAPPSGSSLG